MSRTALALVCATFILMNSLKINADDNLYYDAPFMEMHSGDEEMVVEDSFEDYKFTDSSFTLYPLCLLSYAAGRYISIRENYTSVELFAPLISSQSCFQPFVDLTMYRFDRGRWASSIGGGIRTEITSDMMVGINAYYDSLQGHSKDWFNQIGVGAEWLTSCGDVRINGYFPIGRKTLVNGICIFDQLGDGFFATKRNNEFALTGFDAEVGRWLFNECDWNLYAAAGPYCFGRHGAGHFVGGTVRALFNWKSILWLQGRFTSDRIYSNQVQGIISVIIPLSWFYSSQCCEGSGCCCDDVCIQPIYRSGLIQTNRCCDWTWNW
jgi:hypothetical protein